MVKLPRLPCQRSIYVCDDLIKVLFGVACMMKVRRRTVEHIFGTLKHWMGSTHFLMKTLAKVGTEMNLHVLAYNLKRLMQILGIAGTIRAIKMAGA
jgi:Transposase DDE domain